jgi:hypothetical protein
MSIPYIVKDMLRSCLNSTWPGEIEMGKAENHYKRVGPFSLNQSLAF